MVVYVCTGSILYTYKARDSNKATFGCDRSRTASLISCVFALRDTHLDFPGFHLCTLFWTTPLSFALIRDRSELSKASCR
jgi:hypothetical protein